MITQMTDLQHFHKTAHQVKARVPIILSQWGLPSKFNRWRLTQDPDSGMVVLFAMLNTRYISTHTTTPFSNYFDPRLLHDLADDLNMQVVSCNSGGLRYAFILDCGSLNVIPTHIDFPFLDGDRLFVRVAYSEKLLSVEKQSELAHILLNTTNDSENQAQVHQGAYAFLKVYPHFFLEADDNLEPSAQVLPTIKVINTDIFTEKVALQKVNPWGRNYISSL